MEDVRRAAIQGDVQALRCTMAAAAWAEVPGRAASPLPQDPWAPLLLQGVLPEGRLEGRGEEEERAEEPRQSVMEAIEAFITVGETTALDSVPCADRDEVVQAGQHLIQKHEMDWEAVQRLMTTLCSLDGFDVDTALESTYLPYLLTLQGTAPRSVYNGLCSMAKEHSEAMLHGVLIPLCNTNLNSAQTELMLRLCKPDGNDALLTALLDMPWHEATVRIADSLFKASTSVDAGELVSRCLQRIDTTLDTAAWASPSNKVSALVQFFLSKHESVCRQEKSLLLRLVSKLNNFLTKVLQKRVNQL